MAEDVLFEKIIKKGVVVSGDAPEETEPSNLLQKLRSRISKPVQAKVDSILGDVQKLSDYDKLYLYLQLPPGPSGLDKSLDVGCVTTSEHMNACTWIRNHLEEHTDTCLPKQDVYDAYKRYCDNLYGRPLSVANFGKIIREIFPNIKARRLGGRGQSKYCYSGLRRKSMVSMPPLPSLDLKMTESSELTDLVQSYNNDVINASCALICNWAEKILKRSFNNVVEVAQFLIQQHIINPRSANAELVLSMVLSENSQSAGQKVQKQPVEGPGNKRPPSPDNSGADPSAKSKKTPPPSTHPGSPPQVKKRPPEPQKPSSSPQVDALVAKLPVLLPRIKAEDKFLSSSPPVRFSPPVLASSILPGLKVSALPFPAGVPLAVTTGVNGTGLLSQPVAPPLIGIIRPPEVVPKNLESHPLSNKSQNGMKEAAAIAQAGVSEGRGPKRLTVYEEGQPKRKRGRPRNADSQSKGPSVPAALLPRVASDSATLTQTKDNATEPMPANYIKPEADSEEPALEEPQPQDLSVSREAEPQTPQSCDTRKEDVFPYQVSVIQDGRQSSAQWPGRALDTRRRSTEPSDAEPDYIIRVQIE